MAKEKKVSWVSDLTNRGHINVASSLEDPILVSTGLVELDDIIGGGIPAGSMVELYGPAGAGKSTLTYSIISQVQQLGKKAIIADVENRFDKNYSAINGTDNDNIIVLSYLATEEYLNIIREYLSDPSIGIIVIDSVAALATIKQLEGAMGDVSVGESAKLMNASLQKLTSLAHENGTIILFVNQMREKIGVMFGSPETRPGGKGIIHYVSNSFDIRRKDWIKSGDKTIGIVSKVKVVKGKSCAGNETDFRIIYGQGIDYATHFVEYKIGIGEIPLSGLTYTFDNQTIVGKKALIQYVQETYFNKQTK